MNCPNCGLVAQDTDKFCIGCGTPLRRPAAEAAQTIIPAEENIEKAVEAVEAAPEAAKQEFASAMQEAEQVFTPAPELHAEEPVAALPIEPVKPAEPVKPVMPAEPVKPVKPVVREAEPVATKLDKPLSTWGYIWRILLFCLPVVSIIPLFIMAFSKGINKNSKHFASAILILMLVALVALIGGVIYLLCTNDPATINEYINNLISNLKGA